VLSNICVQSAILLGWGYGGRQTLSEKVFKGKIRLDLRQKTACCARANWTKRPAGRLVWERKMQMFRNMEVVLMLCFGLICAAAMAARPTAAPAPVPAPAQAHATTPQMPVVVVTGKRLSAAEKAQVRPVAG
jgi:hypothetical protein